MAEKKPANQTKSPAPAKSTRKAPTAKKAPVTLEELQREINERAHELFEERVANRREGDDLSDWLRAENEVKKRHNLK